MIAKSRVSDEVGRADLNKFRSRIRSIFESALPFQKYLLRDELRALSRSDFLPQADKDAIKRVKAVRGIFGDVPANIFTGELTPRHSKRKLFITSQEQEVLNNVARGVSDSGTNVGSKDDDSETGVENLV